MLNRLRPLQTLLLATPLLAATACYEGGPQDTPPELGERIELLNPLDEAMHLNDPDIRPGFVAGQRVLNAASIPEAQRPEGMADYAVVTPETLDKWEALESEVDTAIEDFWLDVAQSPEFDRFRADWLACIDADFATEADVLLQVEALHESGEHDEATALSNKADGCTTQLAEAFNEAARPVYEAWAHSNEPLIKEYRAVVMGAATDFAPNAPAGG